MIQWGLHDNLKYEKKIQGIPAFRDFTIRDPRYFVILFQWKLAKKMDFRKFLKVQFLKTVQIWKIVRILGVEKPY